MLWENVLRIHPLKHFLRRSFSFLAILLLLAVTITAVVYAKAGPGKYWGLGFQSHSPLLSLPSCTLRQGRARIARRVIGCRPSRHYLTPHGVLFISGNRRKLRVQVDDTAGNGPCRSWRRHVQRYHVTEEKQGSTCVLGVDDVAGNVCQALSGFDDVAGNACKALRKGCSGQYRTRGVVRSDRGDGLQP